MPDSCPAHGCMCSCRHTDTQIALGKRLERAEKRADDNCSLFLSYATLAVEEACPKPALFAGCYECLHHSGEQIYMNI